MAIIPSTGSTITSLYEKETTLSEVLAELGLTPLDEKSERELRLRLGRAFGKWREPHTGVKAGELANRLSQLTDDLEKSDELLSSLEPGIQKIENVEGCVPACPGTDRSSGN